VSDGARPVTVRLVAVGPPTATACVVTPVVTSNVFSANPVSGKFVLAASVNVTVSVPTAVVVTAVIEGAAGAAAAVRVLVGKLEATTDCANPFSE
jgi:hypothetical protein